MISRSCSACTAGYHRLAVQLLTRSSPAVSSFRTLPTSTTVSAPQPSNRSESCAAGIVSKPGARGSALRRPGQILRTGSAWSPEMQERCIGDVRICKALWHLLQPDGYSRRAMELEHRAAAVCDRITADGVPFNTHAAKRLDGAPRPAQGQAGAAISRHQLEFTPADRRTARSARM